MLLVGVSQEKFLKCLRSMTEQVSPFSRRLTKQVDAVALMKDAMMTIFLPVGPEVDLDASVKERMVVHAGGVIRIIAYVSGQPTPEIIWSRDGAALPLEAKVETTVISSALIIKPCSRKHLGVYTLTAKNAGGEKKKTVTVEVLGNCCSGVKLLCEDYCILFSSIKT